MTVASPAPGPAVRLGALSSACLVSFVIGLAVEWAWSRFAVVVMQEPGALASLQPAAVVVAAAVPVMGNWLGYFMTHRRPTHRSRRLYTGPSILLAVVGLAVALARLPASAGPRSVAVTAVVVTITPVVTVAILLTRRNLLRGGPPPPATDTVPDP